MAQLNKVLNILLLSGVLVFVYSGTLQAQLREPSHIHTHHDRVPNPCNGSIYQSGTEIFAVDNNGNWDSPGTWNLNRIPTANDIVIVPAGTLVRVNNGSAEAKNLCIHGTLQFVESIDTRLTVSTIAVFSDGTMRIGSRNFPIAPTARAEVVFRDTPLVSSVDPSQYLSGLLVWGSLEVHGNVLAPTWTRLASEPLAGQRSVLLSESPTGWRAGDRIVIPGSHQQRTEGGGPPRDTYYWEEHRIRSINGTTLVLESALQYDHPGARDYLGKLDFLPHVGNLSRNVIFRSQSPSEVNKSRYCAAGDKFTDADNCVTRAHSWYTRNATVDIRYAAFVEMGRTLSRPLDNTTFDSHGNPTHIGSNQIARYAIHFHHLVGPRGLPDSVAQFNFIGNAIDGGTSAHEFKWGIAVHGSHFGVLSENVLYNIAGAGIVTEDGSETGNLFERNFVVRIVGQGGRLESEFREGVGFYLRGPNNVLRDNVAANMGESGVEAAYCYKYNFTYLGTLKIPRFKGADVHIEGEYTLRDGNSMAIREQRGNECYSSMQGITIWWACTRDTAPTACDQNPAVPSGKSVFRDIKLWHISRYTFYGYPLQNVVFQNWKVRGDASLIHGDCCEIGGVFWWGDYLARNLEILGADIQGIKEFKVPYFSSGTFEVRDSFFAVRNGITVQTSHAPGSCPRCSLPERRQIFRNVRFGALPGRSLQTIRMRANLSQGDLLTRDETVVCGFDGDGNDNFQLSYLEQAPEFLLPDSQLTLKSCPGGSMSNQECWNRYGAALAGAVSPCNSERDVASGLRGFTCSTALVNAVCGVGDKTAPAQPRNLRVAPHSANTEESRSS